jgi:hypothetical protein
MESQTTRVLELYILSRIRVPHKWVSLLLTQTYYLDLHSAICASQIFIWFLKILKKSRTPYLLLIFFCDSDAI